MGLMFLGANNCNFLADFDKIQIPTVVVTNDASHLPFENLSSVTTDDCKGAACAVEYLLKAGHRSIAVIGGDRSISDTSALRCRGCMEAFERCGGRALYQADGMHPNAEGNRVMADAVRRALRYPH